METKELRNKSVADLQTDLAALTKEQFNLRMQKATGQLGKTSQIRNVRRDIARVQTIIGEKQRAGGKS
jgi:large subunit ribosomal protein L29